MASTETKSLTDAELTERLKAIAVQVFPSANQWAVADGVKRVIAILEMVGPSEYAALHASLFPARPDDMGWSAYQDAMRAAQVSA